VEPRARGGVEDCKGIVSKPRAGGDVGDSKGIMDESIARG
jgi:hypothetical protein